MLDTTAPLEIALTFDTDSDFFDSSLGAEGQDRLPRWRGVREGIPRIVEAISGVRDSYGNLPIITWFVRVDNQLRDIYGDDAYLLVDLAPMWRDLVAIGHELAYHPHLYRLVGGHWVQETADETLAAELVNGVARFSDTVGPPSAARIGEAYCSNAVMATLDALGLACDSTAMPGRVRRDATRQVDWKDTPEQPYRPSLSDYRLPGDPAHKILELPMSMLPVRADYDSKPFRRYLDLTFHGRSLADGLDTVVRDRELIVTVSHPSGILDDLVSDPHGLVGFSVGNLVANLERLLDVAHRAGRTVRFTTVSQAARRLRQAFGA